MAKKITELINSYIVFLQILILSLLIINSNIHLPCLPEIQRSYGTSEYAVQLSFIINPFVAIFVCLICGGFADVYGRKIVLLWSLSFFIFGTLIVIFTNSIYFFFLGRFYQSLGDGGVALVSGIILADFCKGRAYAKIQAVLSISLSLAWAGAPLLGDLIFSFFGWKGNFGFILILTLFLMAPLTFWKEKKTHLKAAHGILTALKKSKKAMTSVLDSSLVKLSLTQAVPLGIFTAFEFMMPFIYKEMYDFSVQATSIVFFIFISINVFASFLYMVFIDYTSIKTMFRMGSYTFILYFIFGFLFLTLLKNDSQIFSYLIFGLLSFSIPFLSISSSTKIVDNNPHHLGVALALLTMIRNVGTTSIPLFVCLISKNTFTSFYNMTILSSMIIILILTLSQSSFYVRKKTSHNS